jgi:hypothetical protein
MWQLIPTAEYQRRHKRYEKDHPRELQAVLSNLDTYKAALDAGTNPLQVRAGFIHPERRGVVAIDQKGGGPKLAQTRLYVYPETTTETLYVLTLGDKRSQRDDIKYCHWFVEQLRKKEAADDQ